MHSIYIQLADNNIVKEFLRTSSLFDDTRARMDRKSNV